MAENLDDNEIIGFKELLMADSLQIDALCQLLIEKGILTYDEFFNKLKKLQVEYQSKKAKQ